MAQALAQTLWLIETRQTHRKIEARLPDVFLLIRGFMYDENSSPFLFPADAQIFGGVRRGGFASVYQINCFRGLLRDHLSETACPVYKVIRG
jgi:hypothetical protein